MISCRQVLGSGVVPRKAVHDLDWIGRCEDTRLEHRAATLLMGCGDPSRFFVVERDAEGVSRLIIFRIQLLGRRISLNCWIAAMSHR
ncbi:hypothetical protein AVEN_20949-1 [Araneus ventricosus]|uniref:Uncharacterized protein n=1 Tax=Araneus ventricosus TaxID=182803 RepID=A0A4Y2RN19_ARAVE|nr:hypothetical protein AVEN_20949-1 [Araneus ventricosus]